MENLVKWLLDGDPWVKYRTMIDLVELPENDKNVVAYKQQMIKSPLLQDIFTQLYDWPSVPLNSHKSAGHPLHKLSFLADIGLTLKDEPVKRIVDQILKYQSEEGAFQVLMNIPKHFGGTGENQLAWALCDAPLILYALIRFGLHDHPQVLQSLRFLTGQIQEQGYPCRVSKELGKFRGPGKKSDPCPYANLLMLKVFSALPETMHSSAECVAAIETQLDLWVNSLEKHPYMFYAGNDFRKLKVPFIWYDLLHVVEVLSHFEQARGNRHFMEMIELLKSKSTADRYIPESTWKAWSEFGLGQKKEPSPWLTFLVLRIFKRLERDRI